MPSTYFTISDITGVHLPEAAAGSCNINSNENRINNLEDHATESCGIAINRNNMNNSEVTIIDNDNNRKERCIVTNEGLIVNNQERIELKKTNVMSQNLSPNVASNKVDHIDILNFLYPPIELDSNRKVLWSLHDFPENGIFLFEGYKGLEDKERLVNYLKIRHSNYSLLVDLHVSCKIGYTLINT